MGHEKFPSEEAMYASYRTYYGDAVTSDSEVKIISFTFKHANSPRMPNLKSHISKVLFIIEIFFALFFLVLLIAPNFIYKLYLKPFCPRILAQNAQQRLNYRSYDQVIYCQSLR